MGILVALQAWEAADRTSKVQSWYARYRDCRSSWMHLNDYKQQLVALYVQQGLITERFKRTIATVEAQMSRYNDELDELERYLFDNKYVIEEDLLFKVARLDHHNDRITRILNNI